jgi:hypothetical protein
MRYLSFLFLKVAFSYICILSINTKATFAASCSIHEVESNIRNFSRNDQSITNATIKCGAIAIEPLKKALASNNERIRSNAAYALGGLGANEKLLEQTQSVVRQLVQGLKQEKSPSVRTRITKALGNIGNEAKIAVIDLLDLLSQDTASQVRAGAASALGSIQTDKEKIVPALIQALNDVDNEVQDQAAQSLGRWSSELKLENKDVIRALIPLLKDDNDIVRLSAAISLGKLADITYDESKTLTEVRHAIEEMTTMEKSLSIQEFDGLRSPVSRNLRALRDTQRSLTQEIVLEFLSSSKNIILIHSAIWLLLIFAYPKFPQIQAIFFWNPWMRKFFGAGYVGFVLTWVPFFRKKLFEPFRESLLSDADLPNFNSQTYFPSLTVKRLGIEEPEPIQIAIPQLKGQIILEGDSGLGKTMFLRCLCKQSNRVVVYLSARRCQDGVIEAIQKKLHGEEIKDTKFLRDLIYSGAIAICIDGLNEVNADTRAKIVEFTENYFKGDIILATQPMDWRAPTTAKRYVMQPLEQSKIQEFLTSRVSALPKSMKLQGKDYVEACESYLSTSLGLTIHESEAMQRVLSNPMDLSTVALMLATGEQPKLFQLQEQLYSIMAKAYREKHLCDFPLIDFSESVYQMRLNDVSALSEEKNVDEISCLAQHRMVVSRQTVDSDGKSKQSWYFRHDKITEFFILQSLLKQPERQKQHLSDPRFRGVYFMLANFLSFEDAIELRELLIQYAADTKDHTISDEVIQLLRERKAA